MAAERRLEVICIHYNYDEDGNFVDNTYTSRYSYRDTAIPESANWKLQGSAMEGANEPTAGELSPVATKATNAMNGT